MEGWTLSTMHKPHPQKGFNQMRELLILSAAEINGFGTCTTETMLSLTGDGLYPIHIHFCKVQTENYLKERHHLNS